MSENTTPRCPKCDSEFTYPEGSLQICSQCFHEWDPAGVEESGSGKSEAEGVVKDANGVELKDGDTVILIKDLPVKGASKALKTGTKVKNIKLVEGDHNIACRIEGYGAMGLKSQFVKKVE